MFKVTYPTQLDVTRPAQGVGLIQNTLKQRPEPDVMHRLPAEVYDHLKRFLKITKIMDSLVIPPAIEQEIRAENTEKRDAFISVLVKKLREARAKDEMVYTTYEHVAVFAACIAVETLLTKMENEKAKISWDTLVSIMCENDSVLRAYVLAYIKKSFVDLESSYQFFDACELLPEDILIPAVSEAVDKLDLSHVQLNMLVLYPQFIYQVYRSGVFFKGLVFDSPWLTPATQIQLLVMYVMTFVL